MLYKTQWKNCFKELTVEVATMQNALRGSEEVSVLKGLVLFRWVVDIFIKYLWGQVRFEKGSERKEGG